MARYRKRPVVIEAVQLLALKPVPVWGVRPNDGCPQWLIEASVEWRKNDGPSMALPVGKIWCTDIDVAIHTLEGVIYAKPGDWIIRGVHGELYPCKPDIFEKTYEAIND